MIETLFSLLRSNGHEPLSMARALPWSGPGTIEQWPELAQMGYWGGSGYTGSGEHVTETSALNFTAVYGSVRILAKMAAALPQHVFRNQEARGGRTQRVKATADYRYKLLHDQPNEEMHAPLFRMIMEQNRCLWGNAYALIDWRGSDNKAAGIWPMRPDWMTVYRTKSGKKVYKYDPPDSIREGIYSADEVLHYRGLGDDLVGYSPIRLARQGIGLGLAAEKWGANFFRNGARPAGILEVAGKIPPAMRPQIESEFDEKYSGASNSGKTLIVDQGSKFVATTIPPDDAQYLETRQFQSGEITTKIYGIPPHLTGDVEKQTSWGSGVEQMGIVFLTYTLMPDYVMQEAELNMKLLSNGLYCKTNMAAVVRADFKSRQEGLQIMRRNGIINADMWCDFEELDLLPDGLGQLYIVEGNMTTLDKVGEEPEAVAPAA